MLQRRLERTSDISGYQSETFLGSYGRRTTTIWTTVSTDRGQNTEMS